MWKIIRACPQGILAICNRYWKSAPLKMGSGKLKFVLVLLPVITNRRSFLLPLKQREVIEKCLALKDLHWSYVLHKN